MRAVVAVFAVVLTTMAVQYAAQVALSPNQSLAVGTSPLNGCGMCLQVEAVCAPDAAPDCRPASIVALVVDSCASCSATHINLDQNAYQSLGGSLSAGLMEVIFSPTECSLPTGSNVTVGVTGYEGAWLRLVLASVIGSTGISSVELRQTPMAEGKLDIVASAWRRMNNLNGGAWTLAGVPAPPLDLRITDGAHRQLLARKAITEAGKLGVFSTNVQFPMSNSSAGTAAASSASLALPEVAAILMPGEVAPALMAPTPTDNAADAGIVSGSGNAANDVSSLSLNTSQSAADELLLPPPGVTDLVAGPACNTTLMSLLEGTKAFSILTSLIRTSGIDGALADPEVPLTLFAPTNSAWLTAVKQFPILRFDQDALKNVLLQHVIVGKKPSADFSPQLMRFGTLGGGYLTVKAADKRLLVVSQASVAATLAELPVCSSVVHVVNSVLMPELGRRRMRRH